MTGRFETAVAAIDAANAADSTGEALLYGQRMSVEMDRLFPDASEPLRLAARGQHIERWLLPRTDYPDGRTGYLEWRREQGRRHAARVGEIMASAGYDADDIEYVGKMLRKEGLKRDPQVQALEDVICFVFVRHYFAPFADGRTQDDLLNIVAKTARKMSADGRQRALAEFDLPEPFAACFR